MSYVKRLKKLGKDICPEGSKISGRTIKGVIRSIYENCNKLDDLTGTVWKFNDEVTEYTSNINLNFKTNNLEYSIMKMDSTWGWGNISYNTTQVYNTFNENNKWRDDYNETYSAIEITGGDDVKNQDVIAWVQANAKQINKLPALPELPLEDLTGTTWLMPETFVQGSFNGIGYFNFTSNNKNFTELIETMLGDLQYSTDEDAIDVYSQETGWSDEAYRTIEITGGKDATNRNKIAWLQNNATLTE